MLRDYYLRSYRDDGPHQIEPFSGVETATLSYPIVSVRVQKIGEVQRPSV